MPLLSPEPEFAAPSMKADLLQSIFWTHSLRRLIDDPSAMELPMFATDAVRLAMLTGSLFVQA
jgi:hypothetical protein